jgi:hypothetical protein
MNVRGYFLKIILHRLFFYLNNPMLFLIIFDKIK